MSPDITEIRPAALMGRGKRRVLGINSTVDDIVLGGKKWRAAVSDAIVEDPSLTRTMEGASSLEIVVHDPEGSLLNSKLLEERFRVGLDGLRFRFVGLSSSGDALTLKFEDEEVARQRISPGPLKVFRDKMTRAEFIASQLLEVPGPRLPLYCPQLHTVQPIESSAQGRRAEREVDVRRGRGIDSGARLTVKGERASAEQLRNGDRVLRVGQSLGAPEAALVSVIVTGIQEQTMHNRSGGDGTSNGYFQVIASTAASHGVDPLDLEACAKVYFKVGFAGRGGAIALAKQGMSPAEISSAVEGNAAGPSDRVMWEKEAREWVEAFSGGAGATTTVEKRYAFERKAKETIWACGSRLAEEVRWAHFVANGVTYLIAEDDLLRSRVRMRIDRDTPGVDSIDISSWDQGKKVDELSVKARTRAWAAPPGTAAFVHDLGPASGRYIVGEIRTTLLSSAAEITLKRPQRPLPEPAPETETRTSSRGRSLGGGGSDGARRFLAWLERQVGTKEGSAAQVRYARDLGLSPSLPWCSIFVAYGLKHAGGIKNLPSNPAYSGAWLDWSGGRRVSAKSLKPGDIVVSDWGDGGITDHVAVYVGGGQVIGGNQSDMVSKVELNRSAIVGCVRVF